MGAIALLSVIGFQVVALSVCFVDAVVFNGHMLGGR